MQIFSSYKSFRPLFFSTLFFAAVFFLAGCAKVEISSKNTNNNGTENGTYTNNTYGYSFRVPDGYRAQVDDTQSIDKHRLRLISTDTPKDETASDLTKFMDIDVRVGTIIPGLTFEEWIRQDPDRTFVDKTDLKQIDVNGRKGFLLEETHPEYSEEAGGLLARADKRVYVLVGDTYYAIHGYAETMDIIQKFSDKFNDIIKNFTIQEDVAKNISHLLPLNKDVTTWTEYKNTEFGISFKYPKEWTLQDKINPADAAQNKDHESLVISLFEENPIPTEHLTRNVSFSVEKKHYDSVEAFLKTETEFGDGSSARVKNPVNTGGFIGTQYQDYGPVAHAQVGTIAVLLDKDKAIFLEDRHGQYQQNGVFNDIMQSFRELIIK